MLMLHLPQVVGISLEVYLIIGVLFVVHYFAIRWLLRKRVAEPGKRKLIAAVVSLVAAPVVYIGIALLVILSMTWYPKRDFDRAGWLADTEHRYEYADDLVDEQRLIGLSRAEVVAMLGEPTLDQNGQLTYYLGFSPRHLMSIDPDWLAIEFTDARVSRVHVYTS